MEALRLCINLEFAVELMAAEALFLQGSQKKEHYRLKGFGIAALCILLSYAVRYEMLGAFYPWGNMLRCVMILLLTTGGIFICRQCSGLQAMLWGIGGYTVQNMAYAVHETLKALGVIQVGTGSQPAAVYLFSLLIVYGAVYWMAYHLFVKRIIRFECAVSQREVVLLSAGILLIVVVLSSFGYSYSHDSIMTMVFRLLSILSCMMGLSVMAELLKSRSLERDLILARKQAELRADYYERLNDTISAVNLRFHDLKHQLAQYRVRSGGSLQIPREELRELEDSISIYDAIARTGNEALDIVLTDKSLICQKENIRLTYMADSRKMSFLETRDVYSIFGNALDNAIEAVRRLDAPEQKVINLTAVCHGPFLDIHVYNYFKGELSLDGGLPRTSKPDSASHGYGLKSMRLTAEKYGSELVISANDHIFDLNIVLPAYAEQQFTNE